MCSSAKCALAIRIIWKRDPLRNRENQQNLITADCFIESFDENFCKVKQLSGPLIHACVKFGFLPKCHLLWGPIYCGVAYCFTDNNTVNSEIFARVLFSQNLAYVKFHMWSFVKAKSLRNGEITLSITEIGKSCPSHEFKRHKYAF